MRQSTLGYWSATRIDIANYCKRRYYLRYVLKDEPLRFSAYVKGGFLHEIIEKFWDKMYLPGKRKTEVKYSTPEEFSSHAQGKWKSLLIKLKKSGQRLEWAFDGEEWAILHQLPKICTPLFTHLATEGKPDFSELSFDFVLDGLRFKGRVDEVRLRDGKVVIRDYKSGRPWIGDMKVDFDPQLKFYNAGLCYLCCSNRNIAEKLGLLERRVTFMGNPEFVCPDFEEEFFMIEALGYEPKPGRERPAVIHKTKRTNEHFVSLLRMIRSTLEAVAVNREVPPEWGRKCDSCDMRVACKKRAVEESDGFIVDKHGQQFLALESPTYSVAPETKEKKSGNKEQKRLRLIYKNSPYQCK